VSVGREGNAARRDRWGEHQVGDHAPPRPLLVLLGGYVVCVRRRQAHTEREKKQKRNQWNIKQKRRTLIRSPVMAR
jgi:hypothetical protein